MFGYRRYSSGSPLLSFLFYAGLVGGAGYWWWSSQPKFAVVVPAKVFRSAQPSAETLKEYRDRHGIKTVVNLRGPWKKRGWYEGEHRSAAELGLEIHDVNLINFQLPPPEELRRLVAILDESPKPILLHCRDGADRTGLASAVARVLEGESVQEARQEYSLRFGHTGLAHGLHLPNVFDLYRDWLLAENKPHSADRFRAWTRSLRTVHYFGAHIEPVDMPSSVSADQPLPISLQIENTSAVAWPADKEKMQLFFWVTRLETKEELEQTATLPRERIEPGQSITMNVEVPALAIPGSYQLEADVCDGGGIKFRVMGPNNWKGTIEVEPVVPLVPAGHEEESSP